MITPSRCIGRLVLHAIVLAPGLLWDARASGAQQLDTLSLQSPAAASLLSHEVSQSMRLSEVGRVLYDSDKAKNSGSSYCTMSRSLADQGEIRAAVEAATKALFLGVRDNNNELVANAARDLGYAYLLGGAPDRAEYWANQALHYVASIPARRGQTTNVAAASHKTLGDVLLRRARPVEAADEYRQALALGGSREFRALVQAALARAVAESGKFDEARDLLKEAREAAPHYRPFFDRLAGEIALRAGDPSRARALFAAAAESARDSDDAEYHRMWALVGEARAAAALGDRASALSDYKQAMEVAETVRARFHSEEFKAGLFGDLQTVFDEYVNLSWQMGDMAGTFAIAEQGRARAFLDLVRERGKPANPEPPSAQTLDRIEASLPNKTALVVFYLDDTASRAWIIRRGGITAVTLAASASDLAAQVNAFRSVIATRADDTSVSKRLYDELITPLGLRTDEDFVIVPHRALHELPFQALLGPGGRLIEERAVSYLPTATSAVTAAAGVAGQKVPSMLVLADPDLGDTKLDLPGAETEGIQIAAIIGAHAELHLRKTATGSVLITESPQFAVTHIAAHAMVDELDPFSSRVFLAPSADDPGTIEARRFYEINLSRARLVVLSACESGLGVVGKGDEFYGFQRTILASGASALLASLWDISDESTVLLMRTFYSRITAGAAARDALRDAMRALMSDPRYRSPFYWAAFDLIGRWT